MKLRSKIQHSMIMVITVTLLAAYALTTLVIYRQNVGLMEQETRQEANYIVKAIEISGTDYLKQMDEVEKNTRITLIDPAGDCSVRFYGRRGDFTEPQESSGNQGCP